jgi:hypothetical protein
MIKGPLGQDLWAGEALLQPLCPIWFDRVLSESNIADLPSRGLARWAAEIVKGCVGQDLWADEFLLTPSCPVPKRAS